MAWDCKYKIDKDQCRRLNGVCSPGDKGCILHGKYVFPFKEPDADDSSNSGQRGGQRGGKPQGDRNAAGEADR